MDFLIGNIRSLPLNEGTASTHLGVLVLKCRSLRGAAQSVASLAKQQKDCQRPLILTRRTIERVHGDFGRLYIP